MRGKRAFCLLAAVLALFAAGARGEASLPGYSAENGYTWVSFGSYPQWIDGGDPEKMAWEWSYDSNNLSGNPPEVEPSPILWRVLENDGKQIFLLSEYVLFAMAMHPDMKEYAKMNGFFPDTQLGRYLNGVFLDDAFTPAEQNVLIRNADGTLVTLLSTDEANNRAYGLGKNKGNTARKAWATEYAVRVTEVFVYRKAVGMHTCYWMKDPAKNQKNHTRCIKQTGEVGHIACITLNEGVRPVIHLNPENLEIEGGSGTKADPYRLRPRREE